MLKNQKPKPHNHPWGATTKKKKHCCFCPEAMLGVFTYDHDYYDIEKPVRVTEFSLSGVSIKTSEKLRDQAVGFITLFYGRWEVRWIPAMVVSNHQDHGFYCIKLKFNTQSSTYRLQTKILEEMEFRCIEKGMF